VDQENQSELHLPHVFFRPWVGKHYGPTSQLGMPVMVLGESHWCTSEEAINRDFTVELMQHIVDGRRYRYWTEIARVFPGQDNAAGNSGAFWNSVMFYNYIQESVGDAPRIRPTPAMWEKGAPPFLEVLARYQPRLVLAVGKQLWDHLPKIGRSGPSIVLGNRERESWLYAHPAGEALALWIYHPASPKWWSDHWAPWLGAALELARRGPG